MARMLRIHRAIDNGEFPNARSLAAELEVSRKTIRRDIEYMRSQLGLPLEYDAGEFGYYYTEGVVSFPNLQITEGEILALFVAHQALTPYRNTPFEQPLRTAFAKLCAAMGDTVTVDPAELLNALSFRSTGVGEVDPRLFKQVQSAVFDQVAVRFTYRKLGESAAVPRHVHPYHVACINQQWYLFAWDVDREDMRTFVIGRIGEFRGRGEPFERPDDFTVTDHLRQTFGAFRGTGDHRIRLRFDRFAARLIRERRWHDSQVVAEMPDETCELTLQLDGLEEVTTWILGWGEHCEILEPEELKARVRDSVAAMQQVHGVTPQWLRDLRAETMAGKEKGPHAEQWLLEFDRDRHEKDQLSLKW